MPISNDLAFKKKQKEFNFFENLEDRDIEISSQVREERNKEYYGKKFWK